MEWLRIWQQPELGLFLATYAVCQYSRPPDLQHRLDSQRRRKSAPENVHTGKLNAVTTELDVLNRVSAGLTAQGLPFMLTGSFALAHYATPRMTRDIDIVVALMVNDVGKLIQEFGNDFYVDADAARAAAQSERLFNMMHFSSGIKIDLIVRKSSDYRMLEFERRQRATLGMVNTWIVSREDLILSKLVWARDAQSEIQRRDVKQLLGAVIDQDYLLYWAGALGVQMLLKELLP